MVKATDPRTDLLAKSGGAAIVLGGAISAPSGGQAMTRWLLTRRARIALGTATQYTRRHGAPLGVAAARARQIVWPCTCHH
eukprot:COSAG01_NODE_405_length_17466_cov_554.403697_19_plen_81_part_00